MKELKNKENVAELQKPLMVSPENVDYILTEEDFHLYFEDEYCHPAEALWLDENSDFRDDENEDLWEEQSSGEKEDWECQDSWLPSTETQNAEFDIDDAMQEVYGEMMAEIWQEEEERICSMDREELAEHFETQKQLTWDCFDEYHKVLEEDMQEYYDNLQTPSQDEEDGDLDAFFLHCPDEYEEILEILSSWNPELKLETYKQLAEELLDMEKAEFSPSERVREGICSAIRKNATMWE